MRDQLNRGARRRRLEEDGTWDPCRAEACLGHQSGVPGHRKRCFKHIDDSGVRRQALSEAFAGGGVDLRGVELSASLWAEIRARVPRSNSGRLLWGQSCFRGTWFPDDVDFANSDFGTPGELAAVDFESAGFEGVVSFENAEFLSPVSFRETTWEGFVSFERARFQRADLSFASFRAPASFAGTQFAESALFDGVRSAEVLDFENAAFYGKLVSFDRAEIGELRMEPVRLKASEHDSVLSLATLHLEKGLSLRCYGEPTLSSGVDATKMRLGAPSTILLRDCGLVLEHCDLRAGLLIATGPSQEVTDTARASDESMARVFSLAESNLSGVALGDVELKRCCFRRATNVSAIEFGGRALFGRTARRFGRGGRRSLADEYRVRHDDDADMLPELQVPVWAHSPAMVDIDPGSAESAYRALRKALEDSKASPLASDFYYGEMEMRRLRLREEAKRVNFTLHAADRSVLWAYRHVSGYGLWAARTVAFLITVVAAGAFALAEAGYDESSPGVPTMATAASKSADVAGNTGRRKPSPAGGQADPRQRGGPAAASASADEAPSEVEPPAPEPTTAATALRTIAGVTQPLGTAPTNVWGTMIAIVTRICAGILLALTALAVRRRVKR